MGRSLGEATIRQWDALLAHGADVIVLLNAELETLYVSPHVEALLGYTRDELLGRNVSDFVETDDLAAIAATRQELLTMPGAAGTAHFRIRAKDGTYQWVDARATNRLDDPDFRGILVRWTPVDDAKAGAELLEGPRETARLLREHRQLVTAIAHATTREHLAELVVQGIRAQRGADAAGLYVIEPTSGDLVLASSVALSDTFVRGASRYPASSPRLAWLRSFEAYHGAPVVKPTADVTGKEVVAEGITAMSIVPLWHRGKLVGCLNVASKSLATLPVELTAAIESLAAVAAEGLGTLCAERAAQESASRHTALFESMEQGVVYRDAAQRVLDANPAACRMLGITRDTVTGRTLGELDVSPVRADGSPFPREERPTGLALRTGQAQRGVVMGVNLSGGERRWLVIDAVPYLSEDSTSDGPTRVQVVLTDVTDRRRAAEALEEKAAEYKALVAASRDGYAVVSNADVLLDVNESLCTMLGYTREELLERQTSSLFTTLSPEQVSEAGNRMRERGWARFETALRHKDGGVVDVEASAWVLPKDGKTISFIRDVGEAKRAAAVIADHERRYQSMVRASLDAFLVASLDGTILEVNEAAGALLGFPPEAIPGNNLGDVDIVMGRAGVQAMLSSVAKEGARRFETTVRRAGGEAVVIEVSAWSVGPEGPILTFARDLTAERRTREELRKSEEQLRQAQKMEAIGRLAGGIAHDFNNLLTIINGSTELAIADMHDQDPLREELEEVANAGKRAAVLTRQLLTFSRRQVVDARVLDLNAVVTDLDRMLQRLIGEDIELHLERAEVPAPVFMDRGQLEQVIVNLVVNSRDAMLSGGTLVVKTSVRTVAEHSVDDIPAGSYAVVSVEDTGCGMDAATVERIFEPFFTTKGHAGTGLGLSTVYGIVKACKGGILVQSVVGAGTRFDVYLPIATAPREDARPVLVKPRAARGRETILLVEDEPGVRQVIRAVLEGAGYRVLAASGGAEAIAIAHSEQGGIDMLLTDLVMPHMNGRELAVAIREHRPGIKVVFSSGYADDVLSREGVLEKDIHFIPKPIEVAALREKVRTVLDEAPISASS